MKSAPLLLILGGLFYFSRKLPGMTGSKGQGVSQCYYIIFLTTWSFCSFTKYLKCAYKYFKRSLQFIVFFELV